MAARKKSSHKGHRAPVSKVAKRHIDAIGKHCDALKKMAHKPRKRK